MLKNLGNFVRKFVAKTVLRTVLLGTVFRRLYAREQFEEELYIIEREYEGEL